MNAWTNENFSSGNGKLSYENFTAYCELMGVMQAIWVAKHFGVALNTVKEYVSRWLTEK